MDDATLRTRMQDLREGHTGNPEQGAEAFSPDGRWRDNAGEDWLTGRDAIREHFESLAGGEVTWDPFEVVLEGSTALVRYRLTHRSDGVDFACEGWARLGLGEEHLTSWDAIWAQVEPDPSPVAD